MPRESDAIRLQHMIDAAEEARAFCAGHTRDMLRANRQLQLAVVKTLEIVGEAAFHVSAPTRDEMPAVPWAQIVTMRHRLVHAYFEVDVDIVWDTVLLDLPPLVAALEAWLAEHS